MTETPAVDSATHEITAFADQDAGWSTTIESVYEPTMDLGNNSDSQLGDFLSRPIRQSAQSWAVGQSLYYKFNPWTAFCENPFVRDKIKNYELLRMKLHCKMVISGTQFHYGRALVSYNPFTLGDGVTVDRQFIAQDLIAASQKPHFFLNPSNNEGGQLELPFFWPNNYLEIPKADWTGMGEIVVQSFGNLKHANLGNDPVTVTIYIWASDVVLTMPTSHDPPLVSQSGKRPKRNLGSRNAGNRMSNDEYGSGIISKPATAIAKAAGQLADLPIIGPYMVASQIAAGGMAQIAKLFGYSRPAVITDIGLYKPSPTGNLANVDAADAVQKLTLDSKAELSVDSRTVGLTGEDEMGIVQYATRESYLTHFDWAPTDNPDKLLWNTRVLPMQLSTIDGEIHMTPLAHIATAFEAWQGSLKFRFQVVKSNFHKGRLLVRWDPNAFTSAVNYNTNYSRVVDIADLDDFEIVIGWGQAQPWKSCGDPYSSGSNFSASTRLSENTSEGNGILEISVLNELVSPSTDSDLSINVFVSACEDIKFAAPTNDKLRQFSLFKPPPAVLASQSGIPDRNENETITDKPTGGAPLNDIGSTSDPDDPTYLVYFGDPPTSIRELIKRYCFTRGWAMPAASVDTMRVNGLRNKNLPYFIGWDSNGVDLATDGTTPQTLGSTAFMTWFMPCYAGYRGSVRKKYMFENAGDTSPNVVRQGFITSDTGNVFSSEYAFSNTAKQQTRYLSSRYNPGSGAGNAATNCSVNNTVEVEFPFYWDRRFASSRSVGANALQSNSHQVRSMSSHGGSGSASPRIVTPTIQQHDAAGEDFSLFFFTGVPIYYRYTLNETS